MSESELWICEKDELLQPLLRATRRLVRRVAPWAEERVYTGWIRERWRPPGMLRSDGIDSSALQRGLLNPWEAVGSPARRLAVRAVAIRE